MNNKSKSFTLILTLSFFYIFQISAKSLKVRCTEAAVGSSYKTISHNGYISYNSLKTFITKKVQDRVLTNLENIAKNKRNELLKKKMKKREQRIIKNNSCPKGEKIQVSWENIHEGKSYFSLSATLLSEKNKNSSIGSCSFLELDFYDFNNCLLDAYEKSYDDQRNIYTLKGFITASSQTRAVVNCKIKCVNQ